MIAKLIIELTPNEYQLGSDDDLNMGETRNNNKDTATTTTAAAKSGVNETIWVMTSTIELKYIKASRRLILMLLFSLSV